MRLITFNLTILVLGSMGLCFADSQLRDWESAVGAGMGFSESITLGNEDAIFSNPAGISRSRNPRSRTKVSHFSLFSLQRGTNQASQKSIGSSLNPSDWIPKTLEGSIKNLDKVHYLSMQTYPSIIIGGKSKPNILIGFPIRSENKIQTFSSSPTLSTVDSITTVSMALNISKISNNGLFAAGLTVRPNQRYDYFSNSYDPMKKSFSNFKNEVMSQGTKTNAVALDVGMILTAPDYWYPSLSLAIKNLPLGCTDNYLNDDGENLNMCGSIRKGGKDTSRNYSLVDPTEARAGFSINPRFKIGKTRVNLRMSADFYPLPIKTGDKYYGVPLTELQDLAHAGVELFVGSASVEKNGFAIRAGSNEGVGTFGVMIKLFFLRFEYATYGTKYTDALDSERKTDTRQIFNLSLDII